MTLRVAITGAGGLVGRALTSALLARGFAVDVLIRPGGRPVPGADRVVRGSIADPAAVDALGERADVFVHLARTTHRLDDLCSVDYPAIANVVRAASRRSARLVFPSSQAVFGAVPPELLVEDGTPLCPDSAYGAMKAASEWTYRAHCSPPPLILRLPVVIPKSFVEAPGWLALMFFHSFAACDPSQRIFQVRPRDPTVASGGLAFVHVEDVVETIVRNLSEPVSDVVVANLVDPAWARFRELAEGHLRVADELGYQLVDRWDDPADPRGAAPMPRFGRSLAAERLGFESHDGFARLREKLDRWLRESLPSCR